MCNNDYESTIFRPFVRIKAIDWSNLFDELRKNRSTSEDDARKFEFHAYYPPFPLPGLSRQICELEADIEGRESRGPDMENIRIIEMAVDSR